MVASPLITFPELEEGILIKRYKRFLADIELLNGEIVTAHCANTGPMKGILFPGGRVRLRFVDSPTRKLSWSWEQAEAKNENGIACWVGINTSLPNLLVKKAIEAGYLNNHLGEIKGIRSEITYGKDNRSRIDLLLEPDSANPDTRNIYLEVKNTTWVDGDLALFPDTVTKRGQKHLIELIDVLPKSRAVLVPCLSREDVTGFAPGDTADPCYGRLFRKALKAGVEVIPCSFGFHRDHITWEGIRKLRVP